MLRRPRQHEQDAAVGTEFSAQLVISAQTLRPGERFTYTVLNTSRRSISLGLPYRLERLQGDVWRQFPLDGAFRLPLYSLAPGRARAFDAKVPPKAGAGRYRLVKEIGGYPRSTPRQDPTQQRIEVSAEFEVAGEPGPETAKLV